MLKRIFKSINENWPLYLMLVLGFITYFKSLFYGYITWDDPEMVFKNPDVKQFHLSAFFTKHYVGNYIPITMLLHAFNWLLFQDWAGGHHLVSLCLHLMNGYLIYQVSLKLFKQQSLSLIGTLIFLLHPLQIESVIWISELKTILSASFFLLSTSTFIQYLQSSKNKYLFLSLLLYALAALSKPSVLLLPLVLLAITWYMVHSLRWKHFLILIPYLLISIVLSYVTYQSQLADQFINYSHNYNIFIKIGFAGLALFNYLLLFLFPLNQSVIYSYPAINNLNLIMGYVTCFVLLLSALYLIKTKKYNQLLAILFFIINLLLVLQFIPFGEALFADRYMYLAIMGPAWIIAFLFQKIKLDTRAVMLVLMLISSFVSLRRVYVWQSSLSVYEDVIEKYPAQFVALNSAGVECMLLNKHEKSLAYFRKAIQAAPGNYKGYYNLGLLYLKNNQATQAIESLNRSIQIYEYHKAYTARASAYYMLNDLPKAINDATKVVSLEPGNSKAHFVLGNCYNDLNQLNNAIQEYNKAIGLNGDESDYYFKRAIALGKKQQFQDCLNDLIVCLNLKPENYEAHYWKGVSLVNLKKNPCEDFKIAAQNNYEPAISAYYKFCR